KEGVPGPAAVRSRHDHLSGVRHGLPPASPGRIAARPSWIMVTETAASYRLVAERKRPTRARVPQPRRAVCRLMLAMGRSFGNWGNALAPVPEVLHAPADPGRGPRRRPRPPQLPRPHPPAARRPLPGRPRAAAGAHQPLRDRPAGPPL